MQASGCSACIAAGVHVLPLCTAAVSCTTSRRREFPWAWVANTCVSVVQGAGRQPHPELQTQSVRLHGVVGGAQGAAVHPAVLAGGPKVLDHLPRASLHTLFQQSHGLVGTGGGWDPPAAPGYGVPHGWASAPSQTRLQAVSSQKMGSGAGGGGISDHPAAAQQNACGLVVALCGKG